MITILSLYCKFVSVQKVKKKKKYVIIRYMINKVTLMVNDLIKYKKNENTVHYD